MPIHPPPPPPRLLVLAQTKPVMRWEVRWWCGYVTEERPNIDQKAYRHLTAFAARKCPLCAADPVVVVGSRALGLVGQPAPPPPPKAVPKRPEPHDSRTKAELLAEMSQLRDQIKALEAQLPGEPDRDSPTRSGEST